MSTATPVTIYIVHHPECKEAGELASKLYDWFRLQHMSGDVGGAGLPVYFRRRISANGSPVITPRIKFNQATVNVVIALVDHQVVVDERWRSALIELTKDISERQRDEKKQTEKRKKKATAGTLLLPVALHESFYRTAPLYQSFNPIRLVHVSESDRLPILRRAATEATARLLRQTRKKPPLDVFLSHAKQDGIDIAERIRDSVRSFGQLVAWYDANDLPHGAAWNLPMQAAARKGTAAMIATVNDAYPTRPWCRREATLARTPQRKSENSPIWRVQPTVAVHRPTRQLVRGVPMLAGVPRIGWNPATWREDTEKVVDRLVLEVLLARVHHEVAGLLKKQLMAGRGHSAEEGTCFITWAPDTWTLAALRHQYGVRASSIKKIIYPGYGLTAAEVDELKPVLSSFANKTRLMSFEEAWSLPQKNRGN